MNIDIVKKCVADIPHMTINQAERITQLVIENNFSSILELGFRHGVSTCYLAAAVDEIGGGNITTIDLENAKVASPNINELLEKLDLSKYVDTYFEPTSYTWRLMKILEDNPEPQYDLCYLDGAHNWFVDGFAFFLIDRLLKPGGLIIFDDLNWTYNMSPSLRHSEFVKNMPEDEQNTPQIRKVYELLVKPHSSYYNFMEENDWAFAWKKSNLISESHKDIRTEIVKKEVYVGIGAFLKKLLKKF